jgi:hypothetical protein
MQTPQADYFATYRHMSTEDFSILQFIGSSLVFAANRFLIDQECCTPC